MIESGLPCVPDEPSPAAGNSTIGVGANGFPSLSQDAQGEKVAKISSPTTLKSSSCDGVSGAWKRLGNKLKFIVRSLSWPPDNPETDRKRAAPPSADFRLSVSPQLLDASSSVSKFDSQARDI
jgi:hypothetical protein